MRKGLWLVAVLAAVVAGARCGSDGSPVEPGPVCSFAVSPASLAFEASGGNGTVTMTTAAGCSWSAASNANWITVTAGSSGSGPGSISYSVAQNSSTESRSGGLTIGGQSHAVTQQGRPQTECTYGISQDHADFGIEAGTGSFAVTAPAGCAWTATSSASWLVITGGGQGEGNGTVAYSVTANSEIAGRLATITAAGRVFTVRQNGNPSSCQYSVVPVQFDPCMPAGTVTATITTQESCPWTATPNVSWLTLNAGDGTGSGVITINYSENYDARRDGIVMVRWPTPTAGQNIRVAQAGCLYATSRTDISFAAGGGAGTFDVIQQSDPIICGSATQDRCIWSARADVTWITITSSMPRSGDNPVAFAVAANNSTTPRTGRIIVRDRVVLITQAGQ